MAALLIYLFSKINGLKAASSTRVGTRLCHHLGLNLPSVPHVVLDLDYLSQFEEIFVIGDVHGCYDELVALLDVANVKNDKVLKIFVGDLINKGPKNYEVLKFVQSDSSCISVRGNHDEVVMKVINDNVQSQKEPLEKNQWMLKLSKDDVAYLNNLPYTISAPSLNLIIVHAGLIPGVALERIAPYYLVNMRNIIIEDYFSGAGVKASQHDVDGEPWAKLWPGPQHVYFGHDAKRMLQCYPFATGLDTGCVYGKQLTGKFIYGPRCGRFVDVNAKQIHQEIVK